MTEHTTSGGLTEDEQEALRAVRWEYVSALDAAVERILVDRLKAVQAEANARLRARLGAVEALAEDLTAEVEELRADVPPVGPSRVAHLYRTAGLSEARDRLRAALDSPTSHAQQEAEVGARVLREAAAALNTEDAATDVALLGVDYVIQRLRARADALAADTTNPAPNDQETP